MPAVIGYQDYAGNAVLAGGSWVSTLPLTNMQDNDPRKVSRSSDATAASTQFTVDLGTTRNIGMIVLGPTNLSPGSTTRIRSYSDSGLTSNLYDSGSLTTEGSVIDWTNDTLWLEWEDENFWLGIAPSDVDELPLYVIAVISAANASQGVAQFWKIEITDASNTDGHIDVGRLFMGRVYRPSINYAADSNEASFNWLTDVAESLGGKKTYNFRGFRRRLRLSWPMLPDSEVFSDWFRVALKSRTDKQVFILPEESDDATLKRKRAFLATLTATPPIAQLAASLASTSMDVEEVI